MEDECLSCGRELDEEDYVFEYNDHLGHPTSPKEKVLIGYKCTTCGYEEDIF